MPQTVMTIIGTRPEAIKLVPLVLELQSRPDEFKSVVCVTGQHREMLDQVLDAFGVVADHDLNLMAPGQSLGQITARAVAGLTKVCENDRPDVILVQGDTTTAFCGALVGHYQQIKIGHVEAGLRTGNKFSPFPEEINRRLIGQMADLHFPPTAHAESTLLSEGVSTDDVFLTGNTVIDTLLLTRDRVTQNIPEAAQAIRPLTKDTRVVLVTGHRRESHGQGFENICNAIRNVADKFEDVNFIYPVHLNPKVQEPVNRILGAHPRIHLVAPLSYEPFVWLLNQSDVVLTDSGGVQEEAPSFGKPVLVMRDTTERPEGVEAGNAKLVGTCQETIESELTRLLSDPAAYSKMADAQNPYGDGTASRQIADVLASQAAED
ncbi:UDP-N-acetylglucosamine 2-epimerase (non-hydrolyzing) [bacterium]|nr:UDP-N-acetylglucosamine 2-epimerase (non-hydrolyzing) [bacterium]MDB4484101.1 UDP-N-acetylglucosamine 2-epimerase (non-hydrolyzing) [bacterium]